MRIGSVLALLFLLGGSALAASEDGRDGYFRSDLPLERLEGQTVWPHFCGYQGADGICVPFLPGDWEWRRTGCTGVFDVCGHFVRLDTGYADYTYDDADDRRDFIGRGTPAWIFKLEADEASPLYALQVGYRGGSRYILFSATPDGDGTFKHMAVLDAHCLSLTEVQWRHKAPTRHDDEDDEAYCAVNSMPALIAIAREALARPPAASLTWLGPVPDKDGK